MLEVKISANMLAIQFVQLTCTQRVQDLPIGIKGVWRREWHENQMLGTVRLARAAKRAKDNGAGRASCFVGLKLEKEKV